MTKLSIIRHSVAVVGWKTSALQLSSFYEKRESFGKEKKVLTALVLLFMLCSSVFAASGEESGRLGTPKGIRFFVDAGYTTTWTYIKSHAYTIGDYPNFGFAAGYQVCPYFFAGAGIGVSLYEVNMSMPVFADVRYDVLNRRVSPFIEMRGGYSWGEEGLYMAPSIGCHVGLGRILGVGASVGYTYQKCDLTKYGRYVKPTFEHEGVNFKVAFDW